MMAALLNPKRRLFVVAGDGGFMMNSQELETAASESRYRRARNRGSRLPAITKSATSDCESFRQTLFKRGSPVLYREFKNVIPKN
jgi:hypothetical protein